MITFANPKKITMSSGNESIELTEAGTWESFPPFAEKFANQIGAKIIKRTTAPDMHLWEIEYHGIILNFVYDDFPNGVSIEPKNSNAKSAIDNIFKLISEQSTSDGL